MPDFLDIASAVMQRRRVVALGYAFEWEPIVKKWRVITPFGTTYLTDSEITEMFDEVTVFPSKWGKPKKSNNSTFEHTLDRALMNAGTDEDIERVEQLLYGEEDTAFTPSLGCDPQSDMTWLYNLL